MINIICGFVSATARGYRDVKTILTLNLNSLEMCNCIFVKDGTCYDILYKNMEFLSKCSIVFVFNLFFKNSSKIDVLNYEL